MPIAGSRPLRVLFTAPCYRARHGALAGLQALWRPAIAGQAAPGPLAATLAGPGVIPAAHADHSRAGQVMRWFPADRFTPPGEQPPAVVGSLHETHPLLPHSARSVDHRAAGGQPWGMRFKSEAAGGVKEGAREPAQLQAA